MKLYYIIVIITAMLIAGGFCAVTAQNEEGKTAVQVRQFDRETWQELKKEHSYQPLDDQRPVSQTEESSNSHWLDSPVILDVIKVSAIAFFIIALVYVIIRISGVEIFRSRKVSPKVSPEVKGEENIPIEDDIKGDIEKLIRQAREGKDWKRLVRFLYIKTLKLLDETKMITWSREKTNRDYLNELTQPAYCERFGKLSLTFNRVRYGDVVVDEHLGKNADKEFSEFFRMITNQKNF